MRRGTWHQMGDRSQRLVAEQFEVGVGVGAILSPRDLSFENSVEYSATYRGSGASVLYDPQFHVPDCTRPKLASYPTNAFRQSVTQLNAINDDDLASFARALEEENRGLETSGVISPAVVCEAGRPDTLLLNRRLFQAAKAVGDSLGKPTYATVFLGTSVTSSDEAIRTVFSDATGFQCDGWYFGFEFPRERLPTDAEYVFRCLRTGLELACTGKPVLHAYAGPLGILSPGCGATGTGLGHSQNLWRFARERWEEPTGNEQGGGGDAPPRFFSTALWGTIVYPDETVRLSPQIRDRVMTLSQFSQNMTPGGWSRWDANKHFVHVAGREIQRVSSAGSARQSLTEGIDVLGRAIDLHREISEAAIELADNTNAYQTNWQTAANRLANERGDDFTYLELIS